ncbi:MAG TPA: aminotransferase class III-fold pyridoxal phosphate-dependent enzyme [Acidimicrobiales bacterium]|nr:aminotransferase class III-fold pyridoxal phosphate-dependent enzyme [Acidimicrobiales bacterium]
MSYSFDRSIAQFDRSKASLAGGVSTAFRAAQRPVPICFSRGKGSHLWDIDGNEYVDYVLGFGPLLLGHSPEPVLAAVEEQLRTALGFGASHLLEAELAEAICRTVPSAELCIISNTGSEAVHAAVRIARAATGRMRVVKFLGHYHGWLDTVHTGVAPQAVAAPATGGQDPRAVESVTVTAWNDLDALDAVLGDDVAAVIMEPVNVNGGNISPAPGYLAGVVEAAHRCGALVIFDEVITGYRLALGGAQELYGVTPDLTVLGKALGAGFPISAVCGRADVLEEVATGRVAHVGTFNAGPVCAAAALAAINDLEAGQTEIYPNLDRHARMIASRVRSAANTAGIPMFVNQVGGVVSVFVSDTPPSSYEATLKSDRAGTASFIAALLGQGVHAISLGRFYLSAAHDDGDIARTGDAIERALQGLQR